MKDVLSQQQQQHCIVVIMNHVFCHGVCCDASQNLRFYINSEANASEIIENLVEMFPLYGVLI